jgi:hypothetical protein
MMTERTSLKELIFWFIFLVVALGSTFWLIQYAKDTFQNTDDLVFTKTISKKPTNLTLSIPNFDPINIKIDKNILVYDYLNYKIFPYAVNSGGTGNFVYLNLVSESEIELKHIDSLYVGDRINPISFEQLSNKSIFNYLAHNTSQSFADEPNTPVKLEFQIVNNKLIELAKYFNTNSNDVILSTPLPNANVGSKFDIEFKAKVWLFEDSSVVRVYSEDYQELGEFIANSVDGEWMTADLVNIRTTVDIGSYTGKARIIMIADNPSDMRDRDKSVEFWVNVK